MCYLQSMYTDLIIHQSRLIQLKTVCDNLTSDLINCPQLHERVSLLIERLLILSNTITSRLQCLISFRDSYSNYERLVHRLKLWLQRAEAKMDSIMCQQCHPYDFWVGSHN